MDSFEVCQVEMGTTVIKNKVIFKFPRCYQQNMLKNEECRRHEG